MKLALVLLFCFSLFAQQPPNVTQRQLDRITAKWQAALKLQDWEVRTRLVGLEDLIDGTVAESHISASLKVMQIRVLDPQEYAKAAEAHGTVAKRGKEISRDIEDSILHELMHLRLRDLMMADNDHLRQTEEVTVDRLTSAMLLKR